MLNQYRGTVRLLRKSGRFPIFAQNDNDLEADLKNQITYRDEHYTNLLDDYIGITKIRNILKELHKWIFFWGIFIASIWGLRLMYLVFANIFSSNDVNIIIDAIPLLITALVSFVSTIIVIPRTIAEFLFNTKEEQYITKIILHTQEHDASGRGLFKGFISTSDDKHNKKTDHNTEYEIVVND